MRALRDRKKAVEILEGKRDLEGQVIKSSRNAFDVLSQTETGSDIYSNDMALTSNYSQKRIRKRKIPPNSTDLTEPQFLSIKRQHKNWFHPHLWPVIELAAQSTNYSSRGTVKHLQSRYRDTNLYDSLAASTVNDWLNHTSIKRGWNKRTKKLIEEGTCWVPSQHYKSILDGQLELIGHIKETILGIRSVSLTINANLARNIILGFIVAEASELLGGKVVYQPKRHAPIFSLATTRRFLQIELNWTSRRGTKDGQKTPDNAEEICKETFFRFVYTVRREGINKYLIVNVDQTGVLLVPGGQDNTYEVKRAKQVPIHGKKEKKAFTSALSVDLGGEVLPIQCV